MVSLQHLAFIMDGNGRWATSRGLPRLAGHKAGAEALQRVVAEVVAQNIPVASFYAFSTENWQRPAAEVTGIFALLEHYFTHELAKLQKHNVRLIFIGDHTETSPLTPQTKRMMHQAQATTASNTGTALLIALNYGGHDELARAAAKLQTAGTPITAAALAGALDTAGYPPPDMVIRTSGEQRLSGFMPWQSAYAELYFTPTLWPDMAAEQVQAALGWYATRKRRFGAV